MHAAKPLSKTICYRHLQFYPVAETSMRCLLINNRYSLQRNWFNDVMVSFIGPSMPSVAHLNPKFQPVVNAQLP